MLTLLHKTSQYIEEIMCSADIYCSVKFTKCIFRSLRIGIRLELATSRTQTARFKTLLLLFLKTTLRHLRVTRMQNEWPYLQVLQVILLNILWYVIHLERDERSVPSLALQFVWRVLYRQWAWVFNTQRGVFLVFLDFTCMELIMVLRAKTVAESLSVDWLSNVPCVSISSTATYRPRKEIQVTIYSIQDSFQSKVLHIVSFESDANRKRLEHVLATWTFHEKITLYTAELLNSPIWFLR